MKKKTKPETGVATAFVTAGYIITQDGRPCTIANVSGMRKGGVVMPATGEQLVAMFLKVRDAQRAKARTERCVAAFRGSLVEEWAREKVPALFAGGPFVIVPLGRQGGTEEKKPEEKS